MPGQAATALARQFEFIQTLLDQQLEGFDSDLLAARLDRGNCPLWVVGHLAVYRRTGVRTLGADVPAQSWESEFAMGSDGRANAHWPDADMLRADLAHIGGQLVDVLLKMDDEQLFAPAKHVLTDQPCQLIDNLMIMSFHESYHVGQIGLVRRILGLPPVISNH